MIVGLEKRRLIMIIFSVLMDHAFATGQTGLEIHNKGNFKCHDN